MHIAPISMRTITALALAGFSVAQLLAAPDNSKPARMNCGARIECITPEGLPGRLALAQQDSHAAVLIMEDDSISCPLREGETTFVIALPRPGGIERLKFINENAAARGTLHLAVANESLPANSARWVAVDGDVAFQHKRRLDVSMLGVEAKFVRVTFAVEREGVGLSLAVADHSTAKQSVSFAELSQRHTAFSSDLAELATAPLIAALRP